MVKDIESASNWELVGELKKPSLCMKAYSDNEIKIDDDFKEKVAESMKKHILKNFDYVINIGKYSQIKIDEETGKEKTIYYADIYI